MDEMKNYPSLESQCAKIISNRTQVVLPAVDVVERILKRKEEEVAAAME